MKKLIRWLADVSGVTDDIATEAYKQVGSSMRQNGYWWNGGIMHREAKWDVWNAFFLYAAWLRRGFHGPIGNGMMDIRSKVYDAKSKMMSESELNG